MWSLPFWTYSFDQIQNNVKILCICHRGHVSGGPGPEAAALAREKQSELRPIAATYITRETTVAYNVSTPPLIGGTTPGWARHGAALAAAARASTRLGAWSHRDSGPKLTLADSS
jgi:hypothetical protein